jgi:ribosome-associated protein
MRPRLQIARSALQNLDRNKDSPPIMSKLVILPEIAIDESEIEERFILSSGAGGQNVNKVASAVQLRFDVRRSPSLPEEIRARLAALAGHRLSKDGVLTITARQFRDQARNRADARARLFDLIRRAAVAPKSRKKTRPTKASKERRIDEKKARGRLKKLRGKRLEE